MRPNELKQFSEILAVVAEALDHPLSDAAIEFYWRALRDLEMSQFREALTRHTRDPKRGQFFPKPADILVHVNGTHESRALRAWFEVEMSARRHGSYQSVVFADPITSQVIRELGGWVRVCLDMDEWMQREFERRYQSYLDTGGPANPPALLLGISDRQNRAKGLKSGDPVLIGDESAAQKRLENGDQTSTVFRRLKEIAGGLKGEAE